MGLSFLKSALYYQNVSPTGLIMGLVSEHIFVGVPWTKILIALLSDHYCHFQSLSYIYKDLAE
jgi:hypothetical protein